jgi:chromosome partitioning protein
MLADERNWLTPATGPARLGGGHVIVVSMINIKGGVGKTTLTANLGAELATRGYRVLLIDLDPQASLTFSFFTIDDWDSQLAPSRTIKHWFDAQIQGQAPVQLMDLRSTPTAVQKYLGSNNGALDLIASHLGLVNIDLTLAASMGGGNFDLAQASFMRVHRMLANAMHDRALRRAYDLVLIDCAPNFNLLNKSAIVACDWVLVPAKADHLSTLGIDYLVRHINDLKTGYRNFARQPAAGGLRFPAISPKILGVVFSMVQLRMDEPVQAIRPFIGEVEQIKDLPVFTTRIRQNNGLFAAAPRDGVPVSVKTSAPPEIAKELDALADEFILRTGMKGPAQ